MDRTARIILLLVFIALTAVRLVRNMRRATAKRPPAVNVPSAAGMGVPPPPAALTATASPIDAEPAAGENDLAPWLIAALVFVAGSAVLWLALFGWPVLGNFPPMGRLVAGVLASFYLLRLARAIGERASRRGGQGPPAGGGNPIS
jgi:hypothetical protein